MDEFFYARFLDDDAVFKELARLCKRKTSQDKKGKRSLAFYIRLWWIPGCFWAITNEGIADRLALESPQLRYSIGRVKNVISELKLWRPLKPPYRGLDASGQFTPR